MKELSYVVNIPYGLHARPAAQIAQCVSGVKSTASRREKRKYTVSFTGRKGRRTVLC